MKISRIVSVYNGNQYNIHLFGYNKNKKPIKRVDQFTDYFFYNIDKIDHLKEIFKGKIHVDTSRDYISMYGMPMYKVLY